MSSKAPQENYFLDHLTSFPSCWSKEKYPPHWVASQLTPQTWEHDTTSVERCGQSSPPAPAHTFSRQAVQSLVGRAGAAAVVGAHITKIRAEERAPSPHRRTAWQWQTDDWMIISLWNMIEFQQGNMTPGHCTGHWKTVELLKNNFVSLCLSLSVCLQLMFNRRWLYSYSELNIWK